VTNCGKLGWVTFGYRDGIDSKINVYKRLKPNVTIFKDSERGKKMKEKKSLVSYFEVKQKRGREYFCRLM